MKKTSIPKSKNNLKHLIDTKTYFVGKFKFKFKIDRQKLFVKFNFIKKYYQSILHDNLI